MLQAISKINFTLPQTLDSRLTFGSVFHVKMVKFNPVSIMNNSSLLKYGGKEPFLTLEV